MKTIKESKKKLAILWGRPQPTQATYRPMKYLLKVEVEEGLLLYNIVTSEMVLLDDFEANMFKSLPIRYNEEMNELIARHFLVKDDFDEAKSVRQLRALVKKLEPSKRVEGFTILPTTECNARCYYCFESDHKRCTMTERIASDVVKYIIEKGKSKPVEIAWFGGEPLVGKKRISQICEELRQNDITFKSSMVSNAYLFNEELVTEAKNKWNLTNVQITLDGTEEVYNTTKAYINPKDNPYRRVLRNIQILLDNGISVSVRLNVTEKNVNDLKNLIEELAVKYKNKRGLACYSHAVYEGVGFEPLVYNDKIREYVDEQVTEIDRILREKGLLGSLSVLPYLRVINCMSDNDSCRLIYPDGTIGKCENKPSSEGIGDIYDDITDENMANLYKQAEYFVTCENCNLYPFCVNLKLCPETGMCSTYKLDWKRDRYTSIMKETYENYKCNNITIDADTDTKNECESLNKEILCL